MSLREASIRYGLIPPPDAELACGCGQDHSKLGHSHWDEMSIGPLIGKVDAPSITELELSARPHRWASMRKLQSDFFKNSIQLVTDAEENILEVLDLPDIDRIRRAELLNDTTEEGKNWDYTYDMKVKYRKAIEEWQFRFLGDPVLQKQPDVDYEDSQKQAVYTFHMLSAVGVGAKNYSRIFKKNLPSGIDPALIDNIQILPTLDNPYLQALHRNGLLRVKRKYATKYYDWAHLQLERMAYTGTNPVQVGRWIHKNVGEGQGWYWNRITRSESALAINVVYDQMARQANVLYDMWSASPNACPICGMFDGNMWKQSEAPQPVSDSHPHCLCVLIPQWVDNGREIRPRWDRESPYDRPYSGESGREELRRLQEYFNN